MVKKFDFLVIGSGIAGMSFALKVAHKGKVALICKSGLEEANTYFAQGGVASVTNLLVDNFDKHIEDTMIAGDWISDRAAVEKVVREAPAQIEALINWGVEFDKNEEGEFDLHREGGHSEFRILHHKDNTGAEIQDSLIKAVQRHPNITVIENHFAVEILTQHHLGVTVTRQTPDIKCYGAYILDPKTGKVDTYLAKVTLMATGGVGAVYQTTTNPLVATGDGIAMVYRAKGTVKDMEFVQFHPTALYHPGDRPSFLITEAMRGYGAVLRTMDGKEFMQKYDPRLSLAPRDIVARAIDNEMKNRGDDHVYLDVTHKDPAITRLQFPQRTFPFSGKSTRPINTLWLLLFMTSCAFSNSSRLTIASWVPSVINCCPLRTVLTMLLPEISVFVLPKTIAPVYTYAVRIFQTRELSQRITGAMV